MKVKTSITLSEDVLKEVTEMAGSESRSALIERILRAYLHRRALSVVEARDRALLDREAHALNSEALDVLEYQATCLDLDD